VFIAFLPIFQWSLVSPSLTFFFINYSVEIHLEHWVHIPVLFQLLNAKSSEMFGCFWHEKSLCGRLIFFLGILIAFVAEA